MRSPAPSDAARVLRSAWFRWLVAVVLTWGHLATTVSFAHDRFGWPAFNLEPGSFPVFQDVAHDSFPTHGKRLIVSRWDSEHYMGLALRGYSQCPHRKLAPDEMQSPVCDAAFYPGYPALGWLVHRLTSIPIDWAMLDIALVASVLVLFLWTDASIVDAIGVSGAYGSLLAFNFFPTACYLVFIMTDGCTALSILAGFVALARRRYVLAAIAVGFSGAMRISGVGAEAAFVIAIAVWCLYDPPRGPHRGRAWLGRLALVPLGAWGSLAVSGYHWIRFRDPLFYVHGHVAAFHHKGSPSVLWNIQPVIIMHAMDGQLHDLVWAVALVMAILAGHRAALRGFPPPAQAYAYGVAFFTYLISISGSLDLFYMQGLSRYVLVVFLGFLAIGTLLKRRPVAMAFWIFACAWHSREVDLCYFLGDVGQRGMQKCNMTNGWVGDPSVTRAEGPPLPWPSLPCDDTADGRANAPGARRRS